MKILVIDDWRVTSEVCKKYFPDASIDHEYRIPTDLSKLDGYDVLVVDNQGIGNAQWKNGEEFLKDYQPKNDSQIVIFNSGLEPSNKFAELLENKGFFSFTKGRDPDELVALVKEDFNTSERIEGKKRYTDGYMIYGCDNCGQGFRMYLEESLEKGGPSQKPVPFTITCPFCGDRTRDVAFRKIDIPRQLIEASMPAFIDNEGDDCGKPIHVDLAKPEYTKHKPRLRHG